MFNKIIWGTIGGTLWGTLLCAALAGLFIGINKNLSSIVSALFMGILWCIIISMIWKSLMGRKDESSKNYIIAGIIGGFFLGSVIGGLMLAILNRDANFGKAYILGAFLGGIFGFIWSLFKPPMFLGGVRIWGKSGAILGAIWGSFLMAIAFGIIGGILSITIGDDLFLNLGISGQVTLLRGVIIGTGIGSIWGIISGTFWGSFGRW